MEGAAGELVEPVDVGVAFGEHDGFGAGGAGGEPVIDELLSKLRAAGGGGDAAVPIEEGEGTVDVSVAQLVESVSFDGVLLAAVLDRRHGAEGVGEGGEGAAGFDLGELAVVADEYDLGIDSVGVGRGAGRVGGCRSWRLRRRGSRAPESDRSRGDRATGPVRRGCGTVRRWRVRVHRRRGRRARCRPPGSRRRSRRAPRRATRGSCPHRRRPRRRRRRCLRW